MAVDVVVDAETRQALAEALAEIIGLEHGQHISDNFTIAHDIRNAPRITVEVTQFITPEEYDRLWKIMYG